MDSLIRGEWMDVSSRGELMDALSKGCWMDAIISVVVWKRSVEVNGWICYDEWLDGFDN